MAVFPTGLGLPSPQLNDVLKNGGIPELREKPEKFPDLREEMRDLCKTSLYFLGKAVMGWEDMTPKLHWPMCRFIESPPAQLTLLMAFRGSLKSTLGTVGRTIQLQLRKPNKTAIFSEGSTMAEDWSNQARQPFEGGNPLFSWLFPELQGGGQKTNSRWGDSYWKLPHGGTVNAFGLDSASMGGHFNNLILDDIYADPKRDKTAEYAERVIQWTKMSLPLLVNPAKDYRYVTGVRWGIAGDVYAWLHESLAPEHQFIMPFELKDGTYTWPERFTSDQIATYKQDPFVYASQYLLNPVSQDTAVFKKGLVKTYTSKPEERNYYRVAALDPSFSEKRRGHHSALAVADVDAKGHIWIEYALKKKAESHEVIRWALNECARLDVRYLGVECNGPQIAFLQQLKRFRDQFPLHHAIRAIQIVELRPTTDKIARWNQLASGLGSGQVSILEPGAMDRTGTGALISEMYRVTGAKHEENDLTDAAAHLVGPELSKKKPTRLTGLSEDAWLPWALREDKEDKPVPTCWAS